MKIKTVLKIIQDQINYYQITTEECDDYDYEIESNIKIECLQELKEIINKA